MVSYPGFMKYRAFARDGHYHIFNELGSYVVLTPLSSADESRTVALEMYRGAGTFDPLYRSAVASAAKFVGRGFQDFADTFPLLKRRRGPEVFDYRTIELVQENLPGRAIPLVIEALFIYDICKSAEASLENLLVNRGRADDIEDVVLYTRQLIFIADPANFLVDQDEIVVMRKLYEAWSIDSYIQKLRAQFDQVIESYNLQFNRTQAVNTNRLNMAVAVIGLLSVLSVSENISRTVPFMNGVFITYGVLTLALGVLLYVAGSIMLGRLRNIFRSRLYPRFFFWWRISNRTDKLLP